MARRCPHCGSALDPDAPETVECPTCRNIIRPRNPYARRFGVSALITAVLYFTAMFSMLMGDTGWWIFVIFGLATLSGVHLLYVMYHFFKAGA